MTTHEDIDEYEPYALMNKRLIITGLLTGQILTIFVMCVSKVSQNMYRNDFQCSGWDGKHIFPAHFGPVNEGIRGVDECLSIAFVTSTVGKWNLR